MDFEPTKKWLVGDKRTFDKYVITTQYEKGRPTQAQLIYVKPKNASRRTIHFK